MLNHKIFNNKTGFETVLALGSVLRKKAKNDHFHKHGKVGRSDATSIKKNSSYGN